VLATTATTEGNDGMPSPSVVPTDENLVEGSTSPTLTVTGNALVDSSLSPTLAVTTSAPDSTEITSSKNESGIVAVQPTSSPVAEVPKTGSPVAEAKTTGSPIVEVLTTPLNLTETNENVTMPTSSVAGNKTDTAPGLGFAESGSASVDASVKDISGAFSFENGVFLMAAGIILTCALEL
jgi:hypothetical protein